MLTNYVFSTNVSDSISYVFWNKIKLVKEETIESNRIADNGVIPQFPADIL